MSLYVQSKSRSSFAVPDWTGTALEGFYIQSMNQRDVKQNIHFKTDPKSYLIFGLHPGLCDVFVGHETVSKVHAVILWHQNGNLYIIDLESATGTLLNGEPIQANTPTLLRTGDKIQFGQSWRRYFVRDSNEETRNLDGPEDDHTDVDGSPPREVQIPENFTPQKVIPCLGILIKHNKSKNPESRRTNVKVTRSKAEARALLKVLKTQIRDQEEFKAKAKQYSDCGSYSKGGYLGLRKLSDYQKPFAVALFKLKPHQISDIVESESGLHLIFRLE